MCVWLIGKCPRGRFLLEISTSTGGTIPNKTAPVKGHVFDQRQALKSCSTACFFLIFRCFDFGKSCMCEAGDVRVVKTV